MKNAASLLMFLCATAAVVIAGDIKTVVITNSTFSLDIPDHHFLRIYNFTQDGASSLRGVVIAAAATPAPTPTPLPRIVLTATLISASPLPTPEFIKRVVVDGPSRITVEPVSSATLVLTYQRILEPTPTPTP